MRASEPRFEARVRRAAVLALALGLHGAPAVWALTHWGWRGRWDYRPPEPVAVHVVWRQAPIPDPPAQDPGEGVWGYSTNGGWSGVPASVDWQYQHADFDGPRQREAPERCHCFDINCYLRSGYYPDGVCPHGNVCSLHMDWSSPPVLTTAGPTVP